MKELLKWGLGFTFSYGSDVVPRKYTDLELAEEWSGAGMKGRRNQVRHYADTTGRAAMLRSLSRDLRCTEGWC